jgi:hypothetical protein
MIDAPVKFRHCSGKIFFVSSRANLFWIEICQLPPLEELGRLVQRLVHCAPCYGWYTGRRNWTNVEKAEAIDDKITTFPEFFPQYHSCPFHGREWHPVALIKNTSPTDRRTNSSRRCVCRTIYINALEYFQRGDPWGAAANCMSTK